MGSSLLGTRGVIIFLANFVFFTACATPATDTAFAPGVLTGTIWLRPASPVEAGADAVRPLAHAELQVYTSDGREVKAVFTDVVGRYRLELRPGVYRLMLGKNPAQAYSKQLPATVAISPGTETYLNAYVDTGLR